LPVRSPPNSACDDGSYNHFGLGQPILIEYVWGRQIGENTINP
jgi:phospholipid/cholesterol/gamma-HCH transport system substrate-binding protein